MPALLVAFEALATKVATHCITIGGIGAGVLAAKMAVHQIHKNTKKLMGGATENRGRR